MNFGFNDDASLHLAHTDRVSALYPNRLRVSGDNLDVARELTIATALSPILVVGTFNPDPDYCLAQATAALELPNSPRVQLFNEPNNPVFGNHTPAKINKACAYVVEKLGPEEIIGPAMAPKVGWRRYMIDAYSHTGLKHAALHLYPLADTFIRYINTSFETAFSCAPYVHVTEAGCQRSQFPDQDSYTRQLYSQAKAKGARTFIHHRLAEPADPNEWERKARLWLIREDGTRTGLYDAYHKLR